MNPVVLALLQAVLQVLLPFLVAGVVVLAYSLGYLLLVYARNKVGEQKWALIENFVSTGVRAAEQTLGLKTGEQKRAFAMQVIDHLFSMFKIKLPGELVVALIEAVLAREKMLGLDSIRAKAKEAGLPVPTGA